MPGPFPGMDPWLERHWRDVHTRLVMYSCDELQRGLPPDLFARVEERIVIDLGDDGKHSAAPDVRVAATGRRPTRGSPVREEVAGVAVAEPFVIELPPPASKERFIEILDASGGRLITAIEILSPANKMPGTSRDLYLRKQGELRDSDVNLVEMDLLRGGEPTMLVRPSQLPRSQRSTYQICVKRSRNPFQLEVYRAWLRDRLPVIPVPLRRDERDIALDLQPLIDRCYDNGRYSNIDYSLPPAPPLDDDDAVWADQLLRQRGLKD